MHVLNSYVDPHATRSVEGKIETHVFEGKTCLDVNVQQKVFRDQEFLIDEKMTHQIDVVIGLNLLRKLDRVVMNFNDTGNCLELDASRALPRLHATLCEQKCGEQDSSCRAHGLILDTGAAYNMLNHDSARALEKALDIELRPTEEGEVTVKSLGKKLAMFDYLECDMKLPDFHYDTLKFHVLQPDDMPMEDVGKLGEEERADLRGIYMSMAKKSRMFGMSKEAEEFEEIAVDLCPRKDDGITGKNFLGMPFMEMNKQIVFCLGGRGGTLNLFMKEMPCLR